MKYSDRNHRRLKNAATQIGNEMKYIVEIDTGYLMDCSLQGSEPETTDDPMEATWLEYDDAIDIMNKMVCSGCFAEVIGVAGSR